MVHYYFFSLAGPRDKQVVFAIRAELGLTPQMDVGPYAYGTGHNLTICKHVLSRLSFRTGTYRFRITAWGRNIGLPSQRAVGLRDCH